MELTTHEKMLDEIKVPSSLSSRQIVVAKDYTKEKMLEGFNVQEFCSKHGLSSKTFYNEEWMKNPVFIDYLAQLQDAVIPDDEKQAYNRIKRIILGISSKQNPSIKEIELFLSTFSYLAESDKRQQMERLGLSHKSAAPSGPVDIEARRTALIKKLRGED
ncbi:phBC6A51 family helix-turn-helix protein [Metabacillus dongyingensis]|uniref:phBC6A51 family helix-turn-helix protein n=1 Tax=Metabacillus dongyingensis TaxID=2874282 RepID=UPI001CBA7B25|nr:phBC6A51 family helix-turn-helix protein [Metabacillus dongyingensis]UAL53511.1 hypothetical protein K8L98_06920 [Metabacillus dongyingensis]